MGRENLPHVSALAHNFDSRAVEGNFERRGLGQGGGWKGRVKQKIPCVTVRCRGSQVKPEVDAVVHDGGGAEGGMSTAAAATTPAARAVRAQAAAPAAATTAASGGTISAFLLRRILILAVRSST